MHSIIIGDLMLDQYIFGEVNRISPEAPVLVLSYKDNYHVLGGALNVAQNLHNLGTNILPIGIIGNDNSGKKILKILEKESINIDNILVSDNHITSEKTRFASSNHHLLRLDKEQIGINQKWNDYFFERFLENSSKIDFLLISDYGKGVCNTKLLNRVIKLCNKKNINVFVDPKGKNYSKYRNSFCITPNKNEAQSVLGKTLTTNRDFENAAIEIAQKYNIKNCIITRGGNGLTCYDSKKTFNIKTRKINVFDVSGAGDTFISVLSHYYSKSKNKSIKKACEIANTEAGKSVQYFGTQSINKKYQY